MAEAAVAAVSLGASVISFIGLTGQILQGCQFICDCFDDINGAPKEILYILEQLKCFEKGLRNFQCTLEKVKQSTDISESEDEIKLALELSELTVKELQEFVNKYKRNGRNDWWKGFRFAKKKNVFTKYASRLHQAKIDIIGIQSRLNLIVTTDIQQMVLAAATTQSTPSASTTIITTQTTQASNRKEVLISDRTYEDVTYAIHEGVYAGLDPILAQMVKNSVNVALKDFNLNNRSDIGAETVSKHLLKKNEQLPAARDCGDNVLINGLSNPRVVQQTTTKSTINAWLATIIIRSTTTILQQRFCDDTSDSEEPLVTSKTTHKIDIRPNYLIQARYLVFIDQQRRGSIFGCSDMRLRCYNNVPLDAPIAKACRMGDLSMVRRLFAEGKATIHDMTISPRERWPMSSLLFHVWEECYCTIFIFNAITDEYGISETVVRLSKLFKVMEYLIEAGTDLSDSTPNHGTGITPWFWRVIHTLFGCHRLIIPYLEKLIRLILSKSIHDPFECDGVLGARLQDGLWYSMVAQFIPCVQTQEIWPLTAIESIKDELESSKQLSGCHLEEPPWALLRDPQGLYIQRVLRSFKFEDSTLESYCIKIFKSFIIMSKEHDHLYPRVRERIIQCLKAGMKLNHTSQRKRIPYGATLYAVYRDMGEVKLLRSILNDVGYKNLEIDELFEQASSIMLEASLNSIRPSRIMEECIASFNTVEMANPQLFLSRKSLMLDPGYQKFFPDEAIPDRILGAIALRSLRNRIQLLHDYIGDRRCLHTKLDPGYLVQFI
ncbi:uncharacterized protein EAE98_003661 [Botrytis deweyae]|uniref:Fungal N-terminal domain-containing protein n=1 Tax=Botrytis deweyae TaxID=2478750 RepID=A0ABQ7IU57_9HELO|nr:uncharacterized protein EAE98_003661 [Botrytis deweyae]KAF7933952.1 hypothetical protein EAE98_003661 [Botrytis deweyae]